VTSSITGPDRLGTAYGDSGYDPLVPRDLLVDEVRQRQETGYDVGALIREANAVDPADRERVLRLVDRAEETVRVHAWPFEEPDSLDGIRAALPAIPGPLPLRNDLDERIHAAWLGRIAGCNVGKPIEEGRHWTPERIREYLELAGAYPLDDYVPLLDPMPPGFRLRESWPETTRGNVAGSARDDDIDYSILALHLLETHGRALTSRDVGEAWTRFFPLRQLFTAERAAYLNLAAGLEPPAVARHRNPYREWIGAQIRGDVFGYAFPGDPWAAAELAFQDASLSHVGNGIYGEMWSAALNAAAFAASDAHEAVIVALGVIPPRSRLFAAISDVVAAFERGDSWPEVLRRTRERYDGYSWVHTINNAALVTAGLLWGDGDYAGTVGKTVMSGWDTDSNGATVGSVAGILGGLAGLPARLTQPLQDTTRSAVFGYDNTRISVLAERTSRLRRRLAVA
jgi:ADP-ribosylglycohydrolase